MSEVINPIITESTGKDIIQVGKDIVSSLAVIAQSNMIGKDWNWKEIRAVVDNNGADKAFPIGMQFIEKWLDTANKEWQVPWQVNHRCMVELEDGRTVPGMWLQSHYAFPGIQFSRRAFLACPEGLEAGTYHFDFAEKWGNNVATGIKYQFTLTKPVEKGGRLAGCFGAPDVNPTKWKVYSYGADGIALNETVDVTEGETGTNIGTLLYNKRSGNLNSIQEMAYGHNRWKTSAIRQYLNSFEEKGKWWKAQDEWDICPEQLATMDGFLHGLPEEMINSLKKVKVVTYANTVNDEGAEDITYDYVTLPSLEQINAKTQISGEGETHDYWKIKSGSNAPVEWYKDNPKMVTYALSNHASAQSVRLRSASRGYAGITWYVRSSGGIYGNGASGAHAFAPLVCI